MPIPITPRGDSFGVFWDNGLGIQRVNHADVTGRPGTRKHMEAMQAAVQAALDTRVKRTDLAADDEWRNSDPADVPRIGGAAFWGDGDGKKTALLPVADTYVISRAVVVTVLSWDGAAYFCNTRRA